jgi:hypothetical protein
MAISRARRMVVPLGAVVAMLGAASALAGSSPPAGSVRQATGKAGCYTSDGSSEAGPGTCHNIRGGDESTSLAISPDGRFAYLDGYGRSPVPPVLSVLRRNTSNGALSQLPGKSGCFSRDGSSEDGSHTCGKARDLDTGDAVSVVISSDGRFLYVASQYSSGGNIGGIAIFKRNQKAGTLHQLVGTAGCVSATGQSQDGPRTCARAREVDDVSNLHITPDQKFLYASNYDSPPSSGIAIFRLSAKNGTLHQVKGPDGCITDNGTTPQSSGKKVCRAVPNFSDPWDVATPDNRFAYIPASYGPRLIQAFERNAKGGLVPLKGKGGCVSDTGTSPAGACVKGHGLSNPERAVLSKGGRFVYVASYSSPAPIVVLQRNPRTGVLSERSGTAACISLDGTTGDGVGSCRNGRAINGGYAGAVAPDGRTLYFSEYTANALTVFRVSPKTGDFHQLSGKLGCVTPDGSSEDGPDACRKGRSISGAYQVTLGSRGRDVYVPAGSTSEGNGVALFHATP